MHYIIANNPKFDISKVAKRLNEGDTVIHLNKHIGWGKLRRHPISSKCSHEIFFNFKMWGIDTYRRHPNDFSKVYWASQHRYLTIPRSKRPKRVSQLIIMASRKDNPIAVDRLLDKAVKLYFKKESSAVTRVRYKSPSKKRWSAGHKMLRYLLQSTEPHNIKLAGFSFEGHHVHPWHLEKKFSRRREIEIIN